MFSRNFVAFAVLALTLIFSHSAYAQICRPVSQRTEELGCWTLAQQPIGSISEPDAYWYLDTYPTQAAAETARTPSGVVVSAFGKIWLLTIATSNWNAAGPGGERVYSIGPIPVIAGTNYIAQFMEATLAPGSSSPSHTHGGAEAIFVISGQHCMETPQGRQIGRAGGPPTIIPEGPPMYLTVTGAEVRRAFVLILHGASKPATSPAPHWRPQGLCEG